MKAKRMAVRKRVGKPYTNPSTGMLVVPVQVRLPVKPKQVVMTHAMVHVKEIRSPGGNRRKKACVVELLVYMTKATPAGLGGRG